MFIIYIEEHKTPMINLETTFAGIKLKNPLIAGSSGLTNSKLELEEAGVGAIVLKSLFEEQIENHSDKLSQLSVSRRQPITSTPILR